MTRNNAANVSAPALHPLVLLSLLALCSCSGWLFSGRTKTDRSRPVALVETTGGVELGATTEFGILTLGRTATEGPCRVHYFLGITPLVEDGAMKPTGSTFRRAEIDLKTQHARSMDRPLTKDDELVAMWTPDGVDAVAVDVELAAKDGVLGDVLKDPGRELPAGAAIFVQSEDKLLFAGLVSARARLQNAPGAGSYYLFAGVDRIRELLAVPQLHPTDSETRFRPDDITVTKPLQPTPDK